MVVGVFQSYLLAQIGIALVFRPSKTRLGVKNVISGTAPVIV